MGTTITLVADVVSVVITGDRPDLGPVYDKLDGWYGVDNVDTAFVRRPGAPGAFAPEQTFPGAATISIEGQSLGTPYGKTRREAMQLREDMTALYNEGRPITMIVDDDLRTTRREVAVAAVKLPWTIHPDFTYAIDLEAADPRRYGELAVVSTALASPGTGLELPFDEVNGRGLALPSNETPNPDLGIDFGTAGVDGRVVIVNDGNTETISTYTVSGGTMTGGFAIVNVASGERLTYLGDVASGTTVVIDSSTRTAFINGSTPASRWLSSPAWWSTPPRSTQEVAFLALGATSGAPRLDVATAPAFY